MTPDRIESMLHTQPVTDEARFVARPLPATVAGARARLDARGGSAVLRFAVASGAAAMAVVAIAVATTWLGHGGGPSGGELPSSTADASSDPVATSLTTPVATEPTVTACAAGNLLIREEPWGGAAGTRGTSLTVVLVGGAAPCDLPTTVSARILDGSGAVLVSGVGEGNGLVRLEPGAQYMVGIGWSNWCDPEPQPVLRWDVRFGDGEWIDVIEEASTSRPGIDPAVPVPPCMGQGGTNLSVTQLQPGS